MILAIMLAAMCKMSQCDQEAMEKCNFCERHLCATEGCNKAVKVGGLPGWAQSKNESQYFAPGETPEKYVAPRVVWHHCPAHACNRFCPRINKGGTLFAKLDEEELLERIACGNERLHKGKFCKEHTCAAPNCMAQTLESMAKLPKDSEQQLSWDMLKHEDYCQQHIKLKGTDHPKKTGEKAETVSERIERLREAKEAAKAAKSAKPAAKEEKEADEAEPAE